MHLCLSWTEWKVACMTMYENENFNFFKLHRWFLSLLRAAPKPPWRMDLLDVHRAKLASFPNTWNLPEPGQILPGRSAGDWTYNPWLWRSLTLGLHPVLLPHMQFCTWKSCMCVAIIACILQFALLCMNQLHWSRTATFHVEKSLLLLSWSRKNGC